MTSMLEKRRRFKALHERARPFILANAWDLGSARMLAALGAEALGTTSAGHAFTIGEPDGERRVSREEAIAHAKALDAATPLPLSADLENGYGESPEQAAETVRLAIEAGIAGCSIEDSTMDPARPSYAFDHAVARIAACVAEVRKAEAAGAGPFTLLARADGVMIGAYDVSEALRRLRAFEAAGASGLYAPALPDVDALKRVCQGVGLPVNALAAGRFAELSVRDFAEIGVRRISLGSSLARLTHRAVLDAAKSMFQDGDLGRLTEAASGDEIDSLLEAGRAPET